MMIKPYGSAILNPPFISNTRENSELATKARNLPLIHICSSAAANAVMLGSAYFNPLRGFMNKTEALSVCETMFTPDGLFWPVPVLNMVPSAGALTPGRKIALCDPNMPENPVLAIQTIEAVEEFSESEMESMTRHIFKTHDRNHPGVREFNAAGRFVLSGPLQVLNFSYFEKEFPHTFRTAYQIREEIQQMGWQKVVAFQTRNPMHRVHEELCRMAYCDLHADGILIHMLLGRLKQDDIPAKVRDASIQTMVERYFEPHTVLVRGYGFDMLYAGPREAVLHAIIRQNAGCSHLIIGRDHAGTGNYYGPFDAHRIFKEVVPVNTLQIQIYEAHHLLWSKKSAGIIMMRELPDLNTDEFMFISGTRIREMLKAGQIPPPEFVRPEVAKILIDYYQNRF